VPVDHVKLPISDLDESRAFYSAALAPLGFRLVYDGEASLGFGTGDGGEDNEPFALEVGTAPSAATNIAFTASRTTRSTRFMPRRSPPGGRDNGPPGERPYGGYYYAAFVLDPDGHNIEAVYHGAGDRREIGSGPR
jgi:catechol 2,3-dioxygenase-like lactoylglutathione lyase family enzyme